MSAGCSAPAPATKTANPPLAIAFYAPWDPSSVASLARHVEQLDWLVPGWVSITGADHRITSFRDTAGRAIINKAAHRPAILPMVQNALGGKWDGAGSAALFADPRARAAFLDRLTVFLAANHAAGVFYDFEELPASAQRDYRAFLAETRARFAPRRMGRRDRGAGRQSRLGPARLRVRHRQDLPDGL